LVLVVLLTSARVAPGLLSWPAWEALRGATRVYAGSASHPQVPALAEAGVVPEVLTGLGDAAGISDVAGLARVLGNAIAPDGREETVVWLAPAGMEASPELLAALEAVAGEVTVLHGARDLPGAHLIDVVATMDTLRASCPWDRRQTHESLAPHLIEESYEALDALEQGDQQALREELGDVLLQVAFHARIAAERAAGDGGYTIDDVADTLVAKLVRRHPHVFAGVVVGSADEVNRNWDEIKKAERAAKLAAAGADAAGAAAPSVLDGVALGQPALSLAAQVLRRAGRAGYPAEAGGAGDDLGGQLMRLAALAQEAGRDPEAALRVTVRSYMARIRDWEQSATLRQGAVTANSEFLYRIVRTHRLAAHSRDFARITGSPDGPRDLAATPW
jgi:XTP/dITP diphosphohydrolase